MLRCLAGLSLASILSGCGGIVGASPSPFESLAEIAADASSGSPARAIGPSMDGGSASSSLWTGLSMNTSNAVSGEATGSSIVNPGQCDVDWSSAGDTFATSDDLTRAMSGTWGFCSGTAEFPPAIVGIQFEQASAALLLANGDEGFAASSDTAYHYAVRFDAADTTVAMTNDQIARTYEVVTFREPPVLRLVDAQTGQTANFVRVGTFAGFVDGG